jgi:hypothetical protein
MSWTDVLSPAIVSQGPAQCALRPSFTGVFYATMLAPVLACTCAVCLLMAGMLFRPRKGLTLMQSVTAHWQEVQRQRRLHSVLLVVCQLAYMPIVSACLNVFHCTSPIEGVRYLVSDLRVACEGDTYTVLTISAAAVLLVVGIGFPTVILVVLSTADPAKLENPAFHATWGFLFDGYRHEITTSPNKERHSRWWCQPRSGWFPWWESVVLLRKAGIVLLGRLVDVPMLQVTLLGTLIALSFSTHSSYRPYVSIWFQRAESASLLCILVSTLMSIALSQLSSGSASNIGITVFMLGINLLTAAGLLALAVQQRLLNRLQSMCTNQTKSGSTIVQNSSWRATRASVIPTTQSTASSPRPVRAVRMSAFSNETGGGMVSTTNPLAHPRRASRKTAVEFAPQATHQHHMLMDTYAREGLHAAVKRQSMAIRVKE